jgi:recombination protein RecT
MSDPTTELTPFQTFSQEFRQQKASIEKMLPPGLDLERFMRTALMAIQAKPDLLEADRKSLLLSCMTAAKDGLLCDGKEAALNIYNTKLKVWSDKLNREVEDWVPMVQYLPMVKGIIKVLYATGLIAHIDAAAVYSRDHFRFTRGDDARIEHEPYAGDEEPGPIVAAYAIFRMTNGEVHREVMFKRDLVKVRAAAKTQGVWNKWEDQMSVKSVIKRGSKLLPTDSEALERLLTHDNQAMGYDDRDEAQPAATPAATAAAEPTAPATAALTDERAAQDARRPSRLAGIVSRARQAQPAAQPAIDVPWEQ